MKLLRLAGCGLLLSALGGCASITGPSQSALAFYEGPHQVGKLASALPTKRGQACAFNYLGAVATGDASIDAAKKQAGITQVASVDVIYTHVGGYFARYCTVVKGE